MDRSARALLRKIAIDFSCVAIVGFTVLLLYIFAQPYRRGFFCNDESLGHPFHESTVTNLMLYIIGILLPICVMILGEYLYTKNSNGQSSIVLFGRVIPPWGVLAYHKIGSFAFGAATNVLTTDVAKYTIGRLRPHFFQLCQPNIDCTLPKNHHVYFENFTCTRTDVTRRLLKEVRLSFPSGHSSFSAYVMIYLVLYLQLRFTWKGSRLLRHFLQLICLLLAWTTAMSRISDYKHHWSDVLVGMIIGTIISLLTVFGVADLFEERRRITSNTITNVTTANAEKHRAVDYDVETAMQGETSPLRGNDGQSYGGIPMNDQNDK